MNYLTAYPYQRRNKRIGHPEPCAPIIPLTSIFLFEHSRAQEECLAGNPGNQLECIGLVRLDLSNNGFGYAVVPQL